MTSPQDRPTGPVAWRGPSPGRHPSPQVRGSRRAARDRSPFRPGPHIRCTPVRRQQVIGLLRAPRSGISESPFRRCKLLARPPRDGHWGRWSSTCRMRSAPIRAIRPWKRCAASTCASAPASSLPSSALPVPASRPCSTCWARSTSPPAASSRWRASMSPDSTTRTSAGCAASTSASSSSSSSCSRA